MCLQNLKNIRYELRLTLLSTQVCLLATWGAHTAKLEVT